LMTALRSCLDAMIPTQLCLLKVSTNLCQARQLQKEDTTLIILSKFEISSRYPQ